MKFLCSNCGCDRLEEIQTDVQLSMNITDIGEGGDIEYAEFSQGDTGYTDHYQCVNCAAHVLNAEDETITDSGTLYERLKELEKERTFKIGFTAQGYVNQRLIIVDPHYTPEKIVLGLKEGKLATAIQEGGEVVVIKDTEYPIAKVVSVDSHLEYEDFLRE